MAGTCRASHGNRRGLMALGVQSGDRVAIVGEPSPEWLLADFAVQCLGAISYGLYPTSARNEAEYVLRHAGASLLIAEDQEHVDKVLPMLDRLPLLRGSSWLSMTATCLAITKRRCCR